jgi:misacylated tRNA(Ala) deacylase
MRSKALYLEDSYLRECDAQVLSVKNGRYVILDKTIFYPKGGGQPCDIGEINKGNEKIKVVYVEKLSDEISHEVDREFLKEGDKVHCLLNWEHRYKIMRSHTAAHVFASLICKGTGALVTGNQLGVDRIRFDFNLEEFNRNILRYYIDRANSYFKQDIPVRCYVLSREKALKIPGVIKMAEALPPNIPFLRIVEVVGIDKQADGGTHVKNLREIGAIELIKAQNKGKYNRRIYFKLL